MLNKYSNENKLKNLEIINSDEYKEMIKNVYAEWEVNDFSDEWIAEFKSKWNPGYILWRFVELLRAKKNLSEKAFNKKEKKMIKDFEEIKKVIEIGVAMIEAEENAFEEAGIKEGRVEYKCPICGEMAVANRYMHGGRYHGLGSGCKKCGVWHS